MADQNIAFSASLAKTFSDGVGYIEYPIAALASGSSADFLLPKWVQRILIGDMYTAANALIARASYSVAITTAVITAATGLTPVTWNQAKIAIVALWTGGLPVSAKYVALVDL